MTTIAQIRQLSLGYPPLTLFRGLQLTIEAGTTLAILGANGTGKSTFFKALLGVVRPLAGDIHWPDGRPGRIGYLAQTTEFDRRFPLRVRDLVAMGAWQSLAPWSGLSRTQRKQVDAALWETGIEACANRPLFELSDGQVQRALFARVIVQDAALILLDEPFAAVDQSTEEHLLAVIARWRSQGRAVILIMHDLSSVTACCDSALLLGRGMATSGNVDEVLTPERLLAHGYLSASQITWLFPELADRAVTRDG